MKKNNFSWIIIFSLLVFLFTGCASVPLAPKKLDQQAKQFNRPSDKASIYITRQSWNAYADLFKIHIDGRMIGSLAYNTYLHINVIPGNHIITVTSAEAQAMEEINVKASELYFFDTGPLVKLGAPNIKLKEMNATEGMEVVRDSDLAKKVY